MDNLFDFLSGAHFVPRSSCGHWATWIIIVYIGANLWITVSYLRVPFSMLAMWCVFDESKARVRQLLLLFLMFILFCGLGHLMENVGAFVWPAYGVFALWHLGTAIVSHMPASRFSESVDSVIAERRNSTDAIEAALDLVDGVSSGEASPSEIAKLRERVIGASRKIRSGVDVQARHNG